ncbi:ABC transporter ATP-binding protein [Ferrovibrio sp.]|uniref:ABC transporter ATP-binding protein n=1 Tax=Ferrovibrio sp. TaxID=1917215 RepID=UPI003D0AAEF9
MTTVALTQNHMKSSLESQPEEALLRVDELSIRFGGIIALNKVSFDVPRRKICGLIGPNGAGKTTLFNCISRIYAASSGRILFDGKDLLSTPPHRMAEIGIGRTFQNVALFKTMSVLENIMVGAHSWRTTGYIANAFRLPAVRREERRVLEHSLELANLVGLQNHLDIRVEDLPFGFQKRVELARSLASSPKLLLLDEPAAGLNHEEVNALGDLIRRVVADLQLSVLLVEHHMSLVMGVSDKVVALNFGQVIADGTPAATQNHPEVIRAYLGD